MQGSTVPADSKVVIHWHPKFKSMNCAGLAYVTLGRSEELKDIYIKGTLLREGIHASPDALEETNRLQSIFDEKVNKLHEQAKTFWQITYLNVRSLLGCHKDDVKRDNFIMAADMFSLAETWLKPGETVEFDGFEGVFAGHGKGKGISSFSRIECTLVYSIATEKFSSIHLRFPKFDVISMYLSSGCNKEEIFVHLETWIDSSRPTAIMGDFNINYSRDNKLIQSIEKLGFLQLIQEPTRVSGSLIDHIYVNEALKLLGVFTQQDSAYYSDHDMITLYIRK